MIVQKRIMNALKLKKEHGDGKRFQEFSGISDVTFSNAFRTGKMDPETLQAIMDFYKWKEEQSKQFEKQAIEDLK